MKIKSKDPKFIQFCRAHENDVDDLPETAQEKMLKRKYDAEKKNIKQKRN